MSSSAETAGRDNTASIKAMAKQSGDTTQFTSRYCTGHIGFCIPVHRNWYFQSFGANISPYLWHVEIADHAVEQEGDGIIIVNLVQGGLEGSEGVAVERGSFVVAEKQWTGKRHFAITAPRELKAAVEYMAGGLSVYEETAQ